MTKMKPHHFVLKAVIKNSEFNLCFKRIIVKLVKVRNTDIAENKKFSIFRRMKIFL